MTTEAPTTANNAELVARYIKIREAKQALEAAHKAEVAKLDEALARLERFFLEQLNTMGASSVSTPAGVFFRQETTNVKTDDWDQTLNFIRENNAWHMLNRAVNKTAVMEFMQENEDLPPGVSLRRETVVRVHRA